jgi:hypothetical protein
MRLAIISDIHSDLTSLQSAVHVIEKLHCDRLVCLGDIVGCSIYYREHLRERNPDKCVQLVREKCDHVIAGNHDLFATRRMPGYFKELNYPADWFGLNAEDRKKISGDSVWLYEDEIPYEYLPHTIEYLTTLPETMIIDNGTVHLSHFLFPDLTGSTNASPHKRQDFFPHLQYLEKMNVQIGLVGHGHPEGYAEISKDSAGVYGYRQNKILSFPVIIIVPAITREDTENGFLILDTDSMIVEAVSLQE